MLSQTLQFFLFTVIGSTLLFSPVYAQTLQELIDQLRQQAADQLGPDRQGAFYAAEINFAVNPDISTATFYIEGPSSEGLPSIDDPTLKAFRLPLRHVFKLANHTWRPLVQATFAYQTLDTAINIIEDNSIDVAYRTYGGSLTVGVEIPLGKHLVLLPAVDAGVVRFESNADYHGVVANALFKPAFDGLVFNWDADAWLVGASLGLDYRRPLYGIDWSVHGSLTHNYIETFHSSNGLIAFDAQVTTLVVNTEAVIPTGMSVAAFPLALVATTGYTTFLSKDRDELGFDYFFESGLALETDISRKQWGLKKLRLGAKVIYGEDVIGWSTIFSYRF